MMKYEKPALEVIKYDENNEFMTYSGSYIGSQNAEGDAREAARQAMGWGKYDTVIAQKGNDGKWMAYCSVVNGQPGNPNQYSCTSF
ncbi:MAG: hypothetical protein K6E83_04660 [Clostridium sp.]|nr:hypothetical protein [Clostridium sp.]